MLAPTVPPTPDAAGSNASDLQGAMPGSPAKVAADASASAPAVIMPVVNVDHDSFNFEAPALITTGSEPDPSTWVAPPPSPPAFPLTSELVGDNILELSHGLSPLFSTGDSSDGQVWWNLPGMDDAPMGYHSGHWHWLF